MEPGQAREEIRSMGLPDVFFAVWERQVPDAIDWFCRPPKVYFTLVDGLAEMLPDVEKWVPLWETNGNSIVAYDKGSRHYIRYYYEDLPTKYRMMGKTYQEFITAFFLELIESGVWDELAELADLFAYKHLDRLLDFAENPPDGLWSEECARFVASID